jgi:hypothetical protein
MFNYTEYSSLNYIQYTVKYSPRQDKNHPLSPLYYPYIQHPLGAHDPPIQAGFDFQAPSPPLRGTRGPNSGSSPLGGIPKSAKPGGFPFAKPRSPQGGGARILLRYIFHIVCTGTLRSELWEYPLTYYYIGSNIGIWSRRVQRELVNLGI